MIDSGVQVSLEENRVLEALVACEPEALVSLEDAALPARLFLKMFSVLPKLNIVRPLKILYFQYFQHLIFKVLSKLNIFSTPKS